MIILVLSLGMDTLMMSTSLRILQTKEKVKIALMFAYAEELIPFLGLLIGKAAGHIMMVRHH